MFMKKALLIAEKSSEMNTIKNVYLKHKKEFDVDIAFVCQAGHLVTLCLPNELDETLEKWCWENLPFHPKEYGGWKYKVIPGSEQKYNKIKDLLHENHYDFIIHAGDSDQEGELLVNLVLDRIGIGNIPVYRFWTNSQEETDVLDALKNLKNDKEDSFFRNLYHAAIARQHLDYLIGMNGTQAASLSMNVLANMGRCKTVICNILYNREKEIENFVSKTDYGLEVKYDENFTGTLLNPEPNEDGKMVELRFPDKQSASEYSKNLGNTAEVVSVKKEKKTTYAPELYKLSSLQTDASSKYGYTVEEVTQAAQSLYEKGIMSYPRTSCEILGSTMDFQAMLDSVAEVPGLEEVKNITPSDIERVKNTKKYVNDKKMQEQGHYALSPTRKKPDYSSLNKIEKDIYELMCRRFAAIFYPPLVQEHTVIVTKNNESLFKTTGKIICQRGFLDILQKNMEDSELPDIPQGTTVHVNSYRITEKTTTCPKRYTDGELIRVLEKPSKFLSNKDYSKLGERLHIGTDATRAGLIKQLVKFGFIEMKKSGGKSELIYPTQKCMQILERLQGRAICHVDFTGQLEVDLEEIRSGNLDYLDFEKHSYDNFIKTMVTDIRTANIQPIATVNSANVVCKCKRCGGDIIKGKKGYFCSNYKTCPSSLWLTIMGAKITEKDIKTLMDGKTIKKKVEKKDKSSSWEQEIFLEITDDKGMSYGFVKKESQPIQTEQTKLTCPKCGKPMVKVGKAVQCTECDVKIWTEVCKHTFTEEELSDIFETGISNEPIEFISKAGKHFSCLVKLKDDCSGIDFVFE